ncbi:MAG: ATP-dependent RNA helicase RhlB [Gammaproteobacteria bacterium]|nr:ATP-dependent RNA helicase RhlB [Gammaproteobacteria bacterium]MCF6362395.1 ATP-dependent RNA helicase RhlB [Gammaproteobacteria bacterium]
MTDTHLTETSFRELGLADALVQGVETAGFSYCTPIQAETLPLALKGQDVLGQAQTGTGKTAAFLLAVLHRLLIVQPPESRRPNQPRAFILAPTRELAIQIHKDALALAGNTDFRIQVVYGGSGYEQQRNDLQAGVDILIGTPGRLIDYFKQHVYDLKQVQAMVLDEADRMFDLGFIKDIRYLLRRMPPPEERLNMLFSATLPLRVTELAYEHMNKAVTISVETDKVTADRVTEIVYAPSNEEKIPLLLGLLRHMDPTRTIIFVNTKRAAERVWGYLESNGIQAAVLSGDVPQNKRISLLTQFQAGELPVMVATDVAARGLHIADVSHVINYDLPQEAEDYVHRIGRTARAGAKGDAISFACEDYAFSLGDIQDYISYEIPRGRVTPELLAEDIKPRVRIARKPKPGGGRSGSGRDRGSSGSSRHSRGRSGSSRPRNR